ncbi:hypothetical protein EDC01DRAFT_633737 [Geopyxis carbonaria]|nr:hypothetical protein EDC01DRAFT_633737 [Geopyxis carbonaria]
MPQHIKLNLHVRARFHTAWKKTKMAVRSLLCRNGRKVPLRENTDETYDQDGYENRDSIDEDSIHSDIASNSWNAETLRRVISGERRERERWGQRKRRRVHRWGVVHEKVMLIRRQVF